MEALFISALKIAGVGGLFFIAWYLQHEKSFKILSLMIESQEKRNAEQIGVMKETLLEIREIRTSQAKTEDRLCELEVDVEDIKAELYINRRKRD